MDNENFNNILKEIINKDNEIIALLLEEIQYLMGLTSDKTKYINQKEYLKLKKEKDTFMDLVSNKKNIILSPGKVIGFKINKNFYDK